MSDLSDVIKALEQEIGEIDEQIAACSDGGFPFTTAHSARQRLQNVLDVARPTSPKETPNA